MPHCSFGTCNSDSRWGLPGFNREKKFYRFPQPCLLLRNNILTWTKNEENIHVRGCKKCTITKNWMVRCEGSDRKFQTVRQITNNLHVCSKHFEEHPISVMDYEKYLPSSKQLDVSNARRRRRNETIAVGHGERSLFTEGEFMSGETLVIIKNELTVKEEAIMEDQEMVTDDVPTPCVASTSQTHQPQVEEEGGGPSDDSCICDKIINDELVMKEEPMTADRKFNSRLAPQADQSVTETEPDSTVSCKKPYVCDICDYRARQLSHLTRHMKTHTGEKPYFCDLCDYEAVQLSDLKKHMRTHTGEKPYACDICDYRSGHQGSLKRHLKTHAGEEQFVCDMCDYKARQLSSLQRHTMTHTGEKPYACDICDYRAVYLCHLKTHMRAHTGEKPYACDICDYRSGYLSHLKRHMRTHTGCHNVLFLCKVNSSYL